MEEGKARDKKYLLENYYYTSKKWLRELLRAFLADREKEKALL